MAEQDALRDILLPQIRDRTGFQPTPMMTRDEVRQIGGVHEIGAHSYFHASMAHESDDYLREDVRRCRTYFSEKLQLPLKIYALPNGSYRPAQIDILREEGIRDILLVNEDFARPSSDLRWRFTFDGTSRHEVRYRATGASRWPRVRGNAE
jgi:peptidoglycan/xylan/chitin deacetylase (PgdA/CDA1 family)